MSPESLAIVEAARTLLAAVREYHATVGTCELGSPLEAAVLQYELLLIAGLNDLFAVATSNS